MATYISKDQWSPAVQILMEKLSPTERKRFFGDAGQKIVAKVKMDMHRSQAFANGANYRKLKIKWRYHGRKTLTENAANARRMGLERSARRVKGGINFVDKTRVDASTRPLIDTGALVGSWGVLAYDASSVTIGNRTAGEKMKAVYNDDRGGWDWGTKSIDDTMRVVEDWIDKDLFR